MHITALDIGTYSIKLLECTSDKKKIYSQKLKEIVIEQVRSQFAENLSDDEVRNEVIKEILSQLKKDTKFISMVPNEYLTSRFLTLPVKNKKKAEQMIPFQLEEDLPFSLSNAHMGMYIEPIGNNSQAQISIAGLEHFQSIYQGITAKHLPDVITSEMSAFANFVRSEKMAGSFCILDLGHSTTKAYFFFNQNLVAVQTSYIAGKAIEEAISDNYQVPVEEANFFKHQNAFVLSPPQWNDVDENQREFAKTMHQVLSPLISDLKRWILGFRLNSKTNPTTIYICGGTSNLRNIANYLSFELSIKTQHLNILNVVNYRDSDTDSKIQMKFTTAHLLAWAFISKNKIINFLTGDFTRNDKENIPIHSVSYIGIRATFLTLVLMLTLGIERFFLAKESHELDKSVASLLKNQTLEATPKDLREFKKKPNQTLAMLKGKSKMILQEINSIESAARVDGVSPLVQLSQLFKNNPDISLTSFIVNDGSVTTSWQAKEASMLMNIKTTLESTGFTNLNINMNQGNRELLATFNY
jgi:general secretion pathway protein L